ncbi:MAG: hypothetical protein AAGA56_01025 [Myxococcota bacterium]
MLVLLLVLYAGVSLCLVGATTPLRALRRMGWREELEAEWAEATTDAGRVAAVNLALDEVETQLARWRHAPRVAALCSLLGTAAWAIAGGRSLSWPALGGGAAVGVVGSVLCVILGRWSRRAEARRRADVDRFVSELVGDLAERDIRLPLRRVRRRQNFSRRRP